jgi:hypothetical protein
VGFDEASAERSRRQGLGNGVALTTDFWRSYNRPSKPRTRPWGGANHEGDSVSQKLIQTCKRIVVTFGVVAALVAPVVGTASTSPVFTTPAFAAVRSSTVYITRTGKCYHRGSCRWLYASKIKSNVAAAKRRGLRACKVCSPPSR